jgi:Protein of unknown function (DUF3592)
MMQFAESIVSFCLGAFLLSYPIKAWRKVLQARKLPLVDAVILKNEIMELHEPMAGNEDKLYQPQITFSANVNGSQVTSQNLCIDKDAYKYLNRMHAIACANSYPVGSAVQARLLSGGTEPQLMLTAEMDWRRQSHYLAWAVFAMLICLVGLGLAWIKLSVG